MKTILVLVVAGLLSAASALAQSSLSLPAGLQSTPGNSWDPYYPFGGSPERWQWHYDNSEFQTGGPILITEVCFRTAGGSFPASFQVADLEILMASSPTEYWVGSHDPVFDNNLESDAQVVRTGPFFESNIPMLNWTAFGMTTPFLYDPTAGKDFVVQMRTCAGDWVAESLDFQQGSSLTNGGNTYGNASACSPTTATLLMYNEAVPILLIDYLLVQIAPTISLVGGCGQPWSGVTGSGMIPNGLVALGFSSQAGSDLLGGSVCAGTIIDLVSPTVFGITSADIYGDAQAVRANRIPLQTCGRVYLQALDLTTCTVSNVISL